METRIRRSSSVRNATVATTTAGASVVAFDGMVGGMLAFDNTPPTAATSLTFYASGNTTGPFVQVHDQAGAAVAVTLVTAEDAAYALPFDVGGCQFVRIVCNAELGTANTAKVWLKG